jgi:hypothetical protein
MTDSTINFSGRDSQSARFDVGHGSRPRPASVADLKPADLVDCPPEIRGKLWRDEIRRAGFGDPLLKSVRGTPSAHLA